MQQCLIFGDFNHRSIDWKRMQAGAEGARFLELTQDLFLTQHVHVETRGENIVDLILSTEPNMIDAVRVKEPFSDHNIVTCDVIVSYRLKNGERHIMITREVIMRKQGHF